MEAQSHMSTSMVTNPLLSTLLQEREPEELLQAKCAEQVRDFLLGNNKTVCRQESVVDAFTVARYEPLTWTDEMEQLQQEGLLDAFLDSCQKKQNRKDREVERTLGEGATPLILAAAKGQIDCVRALLLAGADTTAKAHGSTALQWSEHFGHSDTVFLLRELQLAAAESRLALGMACSARLSAGTSLEDLPLELLGRIAQHVQTELLIVWVRQEQAFLVSKTGITGTHICTGVDPTTNRTIAAHVGHGEIVSGAPATAPPSPLSRRPEGEQDINANPDVGVCEDADRQLLSGHLSSCAGRDDGTICEGVPPTQ